MNYCLTPSNEVASIGERLTLPDTIDLHGHLIATTLKVKPDVDTAEAGHSRANGMLRI